MKKKEYKFEKSDKRFFYKRRNIAMIFLGVSLSVIIMLLMIGCMYYKRMVTITDAVSLIILLVIVFAAYYADARYWNQYMNLFIIPFLAVFIIYILHKLLFPGEAFVTKDNYGAISTSILSFIGTFDLGYFVYLQNKINRDDDKRKDLMILAADMDNANSKIWNLYNAIEEEENVSGQLVKIPYKEQWRELFYNASSVIREKYDMEATIEWFYSFVEAINLRIDTSDKQSVRKCIEAMHYADEISFRRYNLFEVSQLLRYESSGVSGIDYSSWLDSPSMVKLINNLCEKYYFIIENHIYIALIRDERNCEDENLFDGILNWLLSECPEMHDIVGNDPYRKRIISRVLFDCSIKMEKDSDKIDYVWGCYRLK